METYSELPEQQEMEKSLLAFFQLEAQSCTENHRSDDFISVRSAKKPCFIVTLAPPVSICRLPSGHRGSFRWLLSSAIFHYSRTASL